MLPTHLRKNQRGQALVFSLITMGIIILVMVTMYTMGQQAISKTRLQNTADAAAYSAMQAEARDYNFSAYTNRAIIANQVAVAQVVGLTSWARNINATYNGPASWVPEVLTSLGGPLAKFMWTTPWKVYKKTSTYLQKAMDSGGPIAVKAIDALITVISLAQTIHHYGTALTMGQTIGLDPATVLDKLVGIDSSDLGATATDLLSFNPAYNIIKLNDSDAGLSTPGVVAGLIHIVQWFTFVEKKDPHKAANASPNDGAKSERMAQVTIDSLDKFSRNRNTKDGGPGNWMPAESMYISPAPFLIDPTRLIPYQNGALLMWLWHRGGTELKSINSVKKTWSALDATGFTGAAIFWISILGIPIPIPIILPFIPMGWGAAMAGQSNDLTPGATKNFVGTNSADSYGGVYSSPNTGAAAMIQRGKNAGASMGGAAGLRAYFDVKKMDKKIVTAPALILEIEKSGSKIKTSNAISGGQFALTNGTKDNYMRALSKAEVYFSRDKSMWPRADNKTEYGSLYSPYWQVRLVPNGFLEQYASMSYHLW
ncbi:MAG: Tad domain-containing protein [Oxalicibacterium faecigallinarum]|uniref:Putative Flp pilus-assembly TadG-like N-terminal domain-containing protein n=2 Tax=Oxalicibacterium faecigallinarum TaxID=573741 RepID=A0A8J3ATU9_9BURK|nr:Tad domain-containing protein [Oxalicibacterium faecigallinarum]MDQ7968441.1 Tad domain-containing protein [Oxalicibacterium faecigallinarum]GGI18495.1 hypothetical protein GCM10008066_14300 [Oxalicibacterium faecigallinarum]